MKKIVILLFSVLLFGFKNPNNDAPIIIHFEQILNEYRHSNGLNPIVIDGSIKKFADHRSKSLVTDYSHNGFNENNGLSIGFVNESMNLKGIQFGIYNSANTVKGIQIGIFNISKKNGFQIGIWNVNNKRSMPFINW